LTATDTADQAENCIRDWPEALLFNQGTSDIAADCAGIRSKAN
jgi:hypothetical protein